MKSENPKLIKQIEALTRQISALQIKSEETSEELRRELQKHPQIEVLSVANISDKLRQKEQEILAIVQDRFGGVTEILRDNLLQQAITFKRLDITGSQVYVPLLRMLDDKDILFKDDGQPHDLDLCLVFSDDDFSQKLSQKNIEQFVSMLLPGFEITKVNTAYPTKMSTSIKLRFKDQEIDLNIYGQGYYLDLSGWQFNADRMRLCYDLKDNNWQFAINNNQATSQNQFANCQKFLLALKAGEADLLQANQYASGFLNRMLKDCGRIKLTPSALAGVQDKLLSEMLIILQQDYQLGVNYDDWNKFRQNHCQELVKNSRKDELVMIKNIHQICILRDAVRQPVIIQFPPKRSPTFVPHVTLPVVSLQQLSVIK